jgi:hypothetical protein
VPIIIKVVSSKPVHGQVYSIQRLFGADLCSPPPSTPVSSTNKIDRHDITDIVLKLAITSINLLYFRGEGNNYYINKKDFDGGIYFCWFGI